MNRWQAFGIHLGVSVSIFLVLLGIIVAVWFPGILFSIDGGWNGLRIIIAVDLVLGPLLTLIVFKAGKPGLKFDLTCIALFQAVCMAGGMWVVHSERPVALVLAFDTIYSLTADEFADYEKDVSVLQTFPGSSPKLVYTELPENQVSAEIANIRGQFIGDPLFIQTDRYRPFPATEAEVAAIYRWEEAVRRQVSDELLEQIPESCLLSKFVSAVTTGFVCFDAGSRELVEFYSLDYTRTSTQSNVSTASL
ncbi:MAG: hypothetical protein RKH07_11935 [Gammaproteobacteria bacterium]